MTARAPFRYWGSKARMAPWIIERLPAHDHFVEGCAGSAAVLVAKPPTQAETVNDTYSEVVNFYRVMRDPDLGPRLVDLINLTPYSRSEFLAARAIVISRSPHVSPLERAHAFAVAMGQAVIPGRSGWSFSTTTRAASAQRWASYPAALADLLARFERVQVESLDVVDLIRRYDRPGVLIFLDPPYEEDSRPTSTGSSSAYVEDRFDHGAMLEAVTASTSASFAIVHYPHPRYDDAGLTIAGDYTSHRNRGPRADTNRDRQAERLYVLDRSAQEAQP